MKIREDVFPAHVAVVSEGFSDDVTVLRSSPPTEGSRYVGTARVVVTDEAVFVAIDSNEGPIIVFREKYSEYLPSKDPKKDSRIVTISGKMLAFRKDTNCGCGSRLRGWNPYKTLNSIKD